MVCTAQCWAGHVATVLHAPLTLKLFQAQQRVFMLQATQHHSLCLTAD